MQIRKLFIKTKYNFWFFQISGWLIFGVIHFLYFPIAIPVKENLNQIIISFISLFTVFAITLLLRQIYKSIYLKKQSILTFVLTSLLCSVLASFLWIIVLDISETFVNIEPYQIWTSRHGGRFLYYLGSNIIFMASSFFAWSFFYFGYKLLNDLGVERRKYQETLLLAKEAQLQMLRYQINPHFLFNSLNSIQALMYINTQLADEILTEFSEFLRYTLKFKDEIYVPLEDEFEMISKYLYIEKIRFQDKLTYKIDLSENTKKIKILSFLLQPFVENAIKHGLKYKQDILNINIRSSKVDNWLIINVENSGKWADNNSIKGTGIGIDNVKNRLNNAYPEKHSLEILEENNWVKIKLQLELFHE